MSNTNLIMPNQQQGKRGQEAGNEVDVVDLGDGAELKKSGIRKGDRLSILAVLAPATIKGEQLLVIDLEDVIGSIEGYTISTIQEAPVGAIKA